MASAKEYIEQLAQSAGLSQEEKDNILKIASNEKFAKGLEESVMLRSDYSRQSDALRADQQKAAAERERSTKYYADLLAWKATEEAQLAERSNGNGSERQDGNRTLLTLDAAQQLEKKFTDQLARTEQNFIAITEAVGDLTSDYVVRFKEKPDLAAIKKLAVDKQIPITQAYQEYIAPKLQELQTKDFETKLATAREEGAREYASKHKLPIDSQPREYHTMLDRDPSKQVGATDYVPNSGKLSPAAERNLRDNFVDSWNAQPATVTSGT